MQAGGGGTAGAGGAGELGANGRQDVADDTEDAGEAGRRVAVTESGNRGGQGAGLEGGKNQSEMDVTSLEKDEEMDDAGLPQKRQAEMDRLDESMRGGKKKRGPPLNRDQFSEEPATSEQQAAAIFKGKCETLMMQSCSTASRSNLAAPQLGEDAFSTSVFTFAIAHFHPSSQPGRPPKDGRRRTEKPLAIVYPNTPGKMSMRDLTDLVEQIKAHPDGQYNSDPDRKFDVAILRNCLETRAYFSKDKPRKTKGGDNHGGNIPDLPSIAPAAPLDTHSQPLPQGPDHRKIAHASDTCMPEDAGAALTPVASVGVEKIGQWIRNLGLGEEVVRRFEEEEMDMESLSVCTPDQ
eukprot:747813-Hanusia_phi.AAC.5